MQPERKYRALLPGPPTNSQRPLSEENADTASSSSGVPGAQEGSKKKRRTTAKACNSCREKKIGCNGLQPCSHCQRRGLACEYATISKTILNSIPSGMRLMDDATANTHRHSAELLGILRSLPDDQTRDVLQQLRAGRDASNIVATFRGQFQSAYDVPFHGSLHGVPPPDQNSLEFELMVRHTIAYSPWAPTELPHLESELTSRSGQTLSIESPSAAVSPMSTDAPSPLPYTTTTDSEPHTASRPRLATLGPRESNSSSRGPGSQEKTNSQETPAATFPPLCDERLRNLDMSNWTDVPIPNAAARRALSLYLETDHPITALFDVDLVLNDLVSGGTRFCSRLLVSSLLGWACQGYSTFELEALSWSYALYDEAVELLQRETSLGLSTPTTVAALLYLSMSSVCHAKNSTDATKHLEVAVEMAKSMGLFGIAQDGMGQDWPDGATDTLWEKHMAQTAWGSFVYITIQCAQSQTFEIAYPPRMPIPGGLDVSADIEAFDKHQGTSLIGRTFSFLCKLALIAHDMLWMNHGKVNQRQTLHATVMSMEVVYRRYLEWATNAPLELVRSGESPHHVLLLHMYFHAFVLDLFRPIFQHGDAMRIKLETFTSQQASPEAVCSASTTQLRRIVITYFQTCPSASHSFIWSTALLYVANAALREPPQAIELSERLTDFRTCIMGYQKLQRCFRLAQGIVRGLLSMALREGLITTPEARAIVRDSEEKGRHHLVSGPVVAYFIVDLDRATENRAAASVDTLAADFDELAILNEFTVVTAGREQFDVSNETLASDMDA